MKYLLLSIFFLTSLSSSCQTKKRNPVDIIQASSEKILIVYLSRTKNTKTVAQMIQKEVGGKLVELEVETAYPENYQAIVDQVASENKSGFLPPLKNKIEDLDQYERIFIGYPTWGMQLPPPLKTFLSQNDLSNKTIIPFNTNAGYGLGTSIETIANLCPNSELLEEFTVKGGVERDGILFVMEGEKERIVREDLKEWLEKIGILKSKPLDTTIRLPK